MTVTRNDIIAAARSFINVPWRDEGRNRMGVDCVGLLVEVSKIVGAPHEDKLGYAKEPTDLSMVLHLRKHSSPQKIDGGGNLDGMIGVFAQSRFPCHVGIFSTKNGVTHLIHARADRKRVVEELFLNGAHGLGILKEVRGFLKVDY
jgi:hypothetical protein